MAVIHSLYREAGKVEINEMLCNQCGQCVAVCPADVLTMENGRPRVSDMSAFGYIACGHCMLVCPEGAVSVTGRGRSPDDLFPLPPQERLASAESLAALTESRRSIRRFHETEVDSGLLEQIVTMASTAPMGIPPWDIGCVTVHGRERVQQLAAEVINSPNYCLPVSWRLPHRWLTQPSRWPKIVLGPPRRGWGGAGRRSYVQ